MFLRKFHCQRNHLSKFKKLWIFKLQITPALPGCSKQVAGVGHSLEGASTPMPRENDTSRFRAAENNEQNHSFQRVGAQSHERNFSAPNQRAFVIIAKGHFSFAKTTDTHLSFLTLQISVFTGVILSQFHLCLVETEDNIIFTFSSEITP